MVQKNAFFSLFFPPERLLTRYAYFSHLTELSSLSDVIVRLTCHTPTPTQQLLLLTDRSFHQLTVTPIGSEEVQLQLSAIGNDLLTDMDNAQLADKSRMEIHSIWPHAILGGLTVKNISREPHAALLLAPGAAGLRPLSQSPIQNLLVAGAWTDTGWPANLESALVSAKRCAKLITAQTA